MEKVSVIAQDTLMHWQFVSPILMIRNEEEYDLAVERLNAMLDEVGADEEHPLYELLDTLGTMISAYEEKHHPIPVADSAGVLRYLLEEHGLGLGLGGGLSSLHPMSPRSSPTLSP